MDLILLLVKTQHLWELSNYHCDTNEVQCECATPAEILNTNQLVDAALHPRSNWKEGLEN